jgi:hypothetical protein
VKPLYVFAVLVLLVGFAGGGHLLSRMDRERAERQAIGARQKLLEARLELVRAELRLIALRPTGTVDDIARRRTEALRGAIFALVRTGTVSMPNDPGGAWVTWESQ